MTRSTTITRRASTPGTNAGEPANGATQARAADRAERVAALQEQIVTATAALVDAGAWQRMLAVAARFHHYSLGNQLLIALQNPDATRVAGFEAWKALGRQVRKGERGIAILAPMTFTRRTTTDTAADGNADTTAGAGAAQGDEGTVQTFTRFKVVHVFDVAQTDGDPLPGLADRLTGSGDRVLWDGLASLVAARGYTLTRTITGPDGYTHPASHTVGVRADVSDAHAVMVLGHELAHIWCGHADTDFAYLAHRGTAEIEAQSVAWIIAAAHGLDASAYTSDYLIGWSHGDADTLRATAATVTTAAREILTALDTTGAGADGSSARPAGAGVALAVTYAWVITQDLDNPYDEDPRHSGPPSRVGVAGPSTATSEDIVRALNTGAFFRLLDGDGNPYYIGRCWSTDGPDSQDMFGPWDDYGRADVGATTIQYRQHGQWRPL
ncbi:MAG TPA: ArdC family protein [Pseudonocardiaceae bacterium]|nr:ArdC family protein [Pseudonocardiaceae bacterium]